MTRCGARDIKTLMSWMTEIGKDAKSYLKYHENRHAIYGRKMYDDDGKLLEIRFYQDTYMTDKELDEITRKCPHDVFYVAHK